jgi:hypothetical protein
LQSRLTAVERSIVRMKIGHQRLYAGKALAFSGLKFRHALRVVALGTFTSKDSRRSNRPLAASYRRGGSR